MKPYTGTSAKPESPLRGCAKYRNTARSACRSAVCIRPHSRLKGRHCWFYLALQVPANLRINCRADFEKNQGVLETVPVLQRFEKLYIMENIVYR